MASEDKPNPEKNKKFIESLQKKGIPVLQDPGHDTGARYPQKKMPEPRPLPGAIQHHPVWNKTNDSQGDNTLANNPNQ